MAINYKSILAMSGYVSFRLFAVLGLLLSIFTVPTNAQVQLERISKAERSDGLGYVVRYHFDAPIDSFVVLQPASDLIQMQLYSSSIDTNDIRMPDQGGKIQEVRLYKMDDSYGVDIYLDQDVYVIADAYPDGSSNDILLAMTKASRYDVEVHTQQFMARNWYLNINPEDALEIANTPPRTDPDESFNNLADKLKFDTVIIDPGHGGKDPGAIGYRNTREKDIALAISLKVGEYIEEYLPDVKVVYTRDDDTFIDLYERGNIANENEGDLFLSIHANNFRDASVRGTEVFFLGLHRTESSLEIMKKENMIFGDGGEREVVELTEEQLLIYELANSGYIAYSERIASMMDDQFTNRANRKSRGVKQAGFVVLYEASMPSLLVEVGFLSNPSEQRFLASEYGQSIMASAIFRSVRDYKVEYERSRELTSSN
jgi:N-acetylmuramoyl-L-alanine amidase